MIRSKLGFKALGLCALVLGMMAIGTSAAQATAGAKWMVNGTDVTTNVLKPLLSASIENETASLLTTLVGVAVKVLCKVGKLENVRLLAEGSLSEGKVKFSECGTYLKGEATASAPCLPKTAGVNDVIETNNGVGLLVLVGGVGMTLIRAAAGAEKPLATIESSELCAVGQKIVIGGELILKDCQGKIKEELVTHLVEADASSTLTAGGKPATLDGSANVILTGAEHVGLKWSGLPA